MSTAFDRINPSSASGTIEFLDDDYDEVLEAVEEGGKKEALKKKKRIQRRQYGEEEEKAFEQQHLAEMRKQTEILERMLAIKEEKWKLEKERLYRN